jgi:hypothetical protein
MKIIDVRGRGRYLAAPTAMQTCIIRAVAAPGSDGLAGRGAAHRRLAWKSADAVLQLERNPSVDVAAIYCSDSCRPSPVASNLKRCAAAALNQSARDPDARGSAVAG